MGCTESTPVAIDGAELQRRLARVTAATSRATTAPGNEEGCALRVRRNANSTTGAVGTRPIRSRATDADETVNHVPSPLTEVSVDAGARLREQRRLQLAQTAAVRAAVPLSASLSDRDSLSSTRNFSTAAHGVEFPFSSTASCNVSRNSYLPRQDSRPSSSTTLGNPLHHHYFNPLQHQRSVFELSTTMTMTDAGQLLPATPVVPMTLPSHVHPANHHRRRHPHHHYLQLQDHHQHHRSQRMATPSALMGPDDAEFLPPAAVAHSNTALAEITSLQTPQAFRSLSSR